MKKRTLALLSILALILSLLTACGGGQEDQIPPPSDPAPVEATTPKKENEPALLPDETPVPDEVPASGMPEEAPEETPENAPGDTPEEASEEVPPAAPAPEEPQPEPEPVPDPEPEPDTGLADGTYTISVTLEGGTGRATVESPCTLRVENGQYWAALVWSSPNYDYMKVDGRRYDQTNTEGNSTFEIPVSAFDQALPVIADTIAMSEPHEIDYTLTFDSSSIQ